MSDMTYYVFSVLDKRFNQYGKPFASTDIPSAKRGYCDALIQDTPFALNPRDYELVLLFTFSYSDASTDLVPSMEVIVSAEDADAFLLANARLDAPSEN